jgi:hypothetical protein
MELPLRAKEAGFWERWRVARRIARQGLNDQWSLKIDRFECTILFHVQIDRLGEHIRVARD